MRKRTSSELCFGNTKRGNEIGGDSYCNLSYNKILSIETKMVGKKEVLDVKQKVIFVQIGQFAFGLNN